MATGVKLGLGLKVRHFSSGGIGAVVPDSFNLCREDYVLVEFDGSEHSTAVPQQELEILEQINPTVDHTICRDCAFYTRAGCVRYAPGRMGFLLSHRNGKKVPARIYPDCKAS